VAAQQVFDAIVVGSGAAGGWAAKELTESGLTVLLLEAGRLVSPEADFPLPAPDDDRLLPRVVGGFTGQAIQMRCPAFNERSRRFFVNDRDNPYSTPSGKPFNWFRGRQVGGRLHSWARVVVRMSDLEFKCASRDGYGVDWPISYEDLLPHYDKVEAFLGVHGSADGIPSVPDGKYVDPAAMSPEEEQFKVAVETTFPGRRVIRPRVVKHDPGRIPATIRAALETGRLTLRSDAVVRRVTICQETGKATGVAYVDRIARKLEEVRAQVVVLCAGTIETLRILINSANPKHPDGLGNSSHRLGHYLMDHILVGLGGPLPNHQTAGREVEVDPYDFGRVTGFYIPRFRNVGIPQSGFLRGYALQGAMGRGAPTWYILAHGEMLPRFENCVTVDRAKKDAWDIPIARISCTHSSNEAAMVEDISKSMREMAAAAGLRVRVPPSGGLVETLAFKFFKSRLLSKSGAFLPGSAIHEIGGAGMGEDSRTSVLDSFGRCWDVKNLFVTDGACFPSGCSQNVTLTIMALTVRACDHLIQEYRAGRL